MTINPFCIFCSVSFVAQREREGEREREAVWCEKKGVHIGIISERQHYVEYRQKHYVAVPLRSIALRISSTTCRQHHGRYHYVSVSLQFDSSTQQRHYTLSLTTYSTRTQETELIGGVLKNYPKTRKSKNAKTKTQTKQGANFRGNLFQSYVQYKNKSLLPVGFFQKEQYI